MNSEHMPKPSDRYKGRPRKFPWIFKITEDYRHQSDILGRAFNSEWLRLDEDGLITVKANNNGYAWDGCTPKFNLLDIVVVGVPDGIIDIKTMKPKTYYASLVHDAFYQYLEDVPVTKSEVDRLFFEMLGEFWLRRVYYFMVKHFGARGVKQRGITNSSAGPVIQK